MRLPLVRNRSSAAKEKRLPGKVALDKIMEIFKYANNDVIKGTLDTLKSMIKDANRVEETQSTWQQIETFATSLCAINDSKNKDRAALWRGNIEKLRTAFERLQETLGSAAITKILEYAQGRPLKMDYAIGPDSQLARVYLDDQDRPLNEDTATAPKEAAIAADMDTVFNAGLATKAMRTQNGTIFKCTKDGDICIDEKTKERVRVNPEELKKIIEDVTNGPLTHLISQGQPLIIERRTYPEEIEKVDVVEKAPAPPLPKEEPVPETPSPKEPEKTGPSGSAATGGHH